MITLLTDFGLDNEYVGLCKGVIFGVNPSATIIDLTHGIGPQDIVAAALTLKHAYPYFPEGSIHVAVVDPDVGAARKCLAVQCDGRFFLAPDNGLLDPILGPRRDQQIVSIENETLFRHPVSRTFHGRDIFCPVAAHLSMGYAFHDLGPALKKSELTPLPDFGPTRGPDNEIRGRVIMVDHFGNLITNIERGHLRGAAGAADDKALLIRINDTLIRGVSDCYASVSPKRVLAVWGSRDCLEIAVNQGNAADLMGVAEGEPVFVRLPNTTKGEGCVDSKRP